MSSVLLSVTDLVRSYGTRRAVDGVSFRVLAGQTVGLLGPNGAGKSTTVAMLCGLLRPDAGEILLDGQPVAAGAAAVKRIGMVPQDLALYEDLSARENLRLFGALYGLKGGQLAARIEHVLGLVNLQDRARDKPATFSGGMKRRLNIAAALLHEPDLLILDEPTVGVDPQSRNAIFDTLEALQAQGRALIYTSHYMEEVERLADHIVIIDHGKVLADDTPAALHRRLPARAVLRVDLAEPAAEGVLAALRAHAGVTALAQDNATLDIALVDNADAVPVLGWLQQNGQRPLHFSTARASLEDIFLNLTGRTLRD
ncbi:ABC transporter ATP-binding protein [Herbaspirillum sp. SJZ107]|uniref:ABC transporter ATP-binding protein n=1 Tax=Herbaspirillum sp. SJZ107 TaxID=2572881 RepID=UPI00114FF342|nr:ABC transporter ATP-binding protein [Herbaspirillum sp. SJZ107]TQK02863.1 ABC-2 type transport system ATP-binding protein [Herbaspirillum sp. SJZ107]